MKNLATLKGETELARLKLVIPEFRKLTKLQEEFIVSCFKVTFGEGEMNGMIKAGGILF